MALSIGFVAAASLGAAVLYMHRNAPPGCSSDRALRRVTEILRDDFKLDAVLMNNLTTVSGGFFGASDECAAEVAEMRGSVDASAMAWRQLRYRIVHQDKLEQFAVTVDLGDRVPLEPPAPSFWVRLLARL
jgi:hypothetical protein